MIDSQHRDVPKHIGAIADIMGEWEGSIAEQLELTDADVANVRAAHPMNLKLQA